MNVLLVLLVLIGLFAPIAVAVATVMAGAPKGGAVNRGLALAFGKGLGIGVLIGLLVSAATFGLVLGARYMTGR